VVSVVYSLVIGLFVYKELDFPKIFECLRVSALINGATEFMIGISMAFASYLALAQIPVQLASWFLNLSDNPIVVMLAINLFLLIIGLFIDNIAAVIILTPILLPIVMKLGVDPIHFGLIITVNLACGFFTPPYGINLFVASAISGETIERISLAIIPSWIAMVICLFLFTYVPVLTMGLVWLSK
jgi:C4-dicarboxylate transporter DctM subunit